MNEAHEQFQEAFEELYTFSITNKIYYLEELLFYFTLAGRGIWSDEKLADLEKLEAFKWLNELIHRIWHLRYDLQRGEDNDSVTRLYNNMKFYGDQSHLLKMHLVPTIIGAFKRFKAKYQ